MARHADPRQIARKREQITAAGGRLFASRGYERTSVADVAEAASMSAASVFYYFGDKAAVFRAVFAQDLPAAEALLAAHADSPDPLVAVLDILEALAEDAADPSASGLLVELLRRAGHDPELLQIVGRTSEVITDGLAAQLSHGMEQGVIDPGLDAVETARWLQAIVDATYLNARPGHSPRLELRRTAQRYLAPHRPEEGDHHA